MAGRRATARSRLDEGPQKIEGDDMTTSFPMNEHDAYRTLEVSAGPAITEAITASYLRQCGFNASLRRRTGPDILLTMDSKGAKYFVEVKTGWWEDDEKTIIGHSPMRSSQEADLVAIVGKPQADGTTIDDAAITMESVPFFYLTPAAVLAETPDTNAKSVARSIREESALAPYEIRLDEPDAIKVIQVLLESREQLLGCETGDPV